MSWQEELQQLDAELAQGRVTPEDYRLRRDQLLGVAQQAASNPPSHPVPAQPEQQLPPPVQPAGSPFGQPFRWQPSNPGSGNVESTQILQPIKDDQSAGDNAERTQVVRGGQGENAERTQVVRGGPPQGSFPPPNYQGGFGTAQPTWNQQQGNQMNAAPWDEDPAPPNFNDVSWMRQGPEVFSDSPSKRGRILVIAGIVVVLLLIGFGTYWFGFRNAGGGPVASNTSAPTTTTTTPSLPPTIAPGRVPQMPGTPAGNGKTGTMSIDEAVAKGALDSATGGSMTKAGASFVTINSSDNTPFHYTITLVNTKGIDQAKTLATTLSTPSHDTGLQPVADHAGQPQSVNVFKAVLPDHTTFRAVYTAGAAVVQVDVSEAPASDTSVTKEFQGVMKAMLENVPLS
jgi:hypothetical protein